MVYCFIDEILRGTNTIERIAASASVLESLVGKNTLCMAATHDIELTRILAEQYDNRHFSEIVDEDGVRFDFLLKPGPTQTRNAIRLLSQLGYPENVITKANIRAAHFEDAGVWR
jgi:DNA mismatch repair ATPase MutS